MKYLHKEKEQKIIIKYVESTLKKMFLVIIKWMCKCHEMVECKLDFLIQRFINNVQNMQSYSCNKNHQISFIFKLQRDCLKDIVIDKKNNRQLGNQGNIYVK